jgi:hypothetical protein
MVLCDIVLNLSWTANYYCQIKKYSAISISASDLDISLTKYVINKLYTVSYVPLETEQHLSETFFSMLNKRVIPSDQYKLDTLYMKLKLTLSKLT